MERGDCPHGYKFSCPICHQKPREISEARDAVHSSYAEDFRKKDATIKHLQAKNKNLRKENAAQAEQIKRLREALAVIASGVFPTQTAAIDMQGVAATALKEASHD